MTDIAEGMGAPPADERVEQTAALRRRLDAISAQPIATRAAEFAVVHDQLQNALQDGDSTPEHG